MSNNLLPENEGKILSRGISRRKFLAGSGAAIGGAALFGAATFSPAHAAGYSIATSTLSQLNSDMDILMFALTLEHIEDAAYRAVNASGLLSGKVAEYFKTFGEHEHAHVVALTDVITKLGGTPVQEQASYNFPKLGSQDEVVAFFAQVEELGAGAYLGAAPLLQDKALLGAAASIHDVEAQHASTLRAVMGDAEPSPAFGSPKTYDEVIAVVGPILAASGGGGPMPGGMPTTGKGDSGFATPLVVVAGLGAAAVGALLRVRGRENQVAQEENNA